MMVRDQPMTSNPDEWFRVEPSSKAPAGVLDAPRLRLLNKLLSSAGNLSHDDIIDLFCRDFRLSRRTVEAALATYRHLGPDSWQ
jgi:hypothetical protein